MNSKNLKGLCEAYGGIYAPQELTEEQVWEEVENWVNSLLEEGYDLSDYTWEEMFEAYLEEAPKRETQELLPVKGKTAGGVVSLNTPYPSQLNGKKGEITYTKSALKNRTGYKFREFGSEANPPSAADVRKDEADTRTTTSNSLTRRNPTRAGSPPLNTAGRLTGSSSTPSQRPAARPSGPVLSKKDGVEGTGVGANFKARAFSAAEKSRYSSVAAQNAAKSSAASATPKPSSPTPAASAPKPPTPAVGMLGNTSFERRTPTSAELSAAIKARKDGASPEKALQAAQKTNLPTTGPTPATPDLGSVGRDLARANTVANLNRAPAGSAAAKALAAKPATSAPTSTQVAGASQGIKPINNKKPTNEMSSYEWPSAKTIRDIAGAYASIYEAKKKVDQDQDGDNDFADVRVARMIASGVPKAKAIAMVKDKSYNEEVELWVNELLEEGYDLSEYTWDDMFEIYEATAMAKRGYDETEIRNKIAKSTGGGRFADKATALENQPTYGNKSKKAARENLARKQRGNFRRTTSSNPGLHGYAYKSNDPAVKAKQAARGAQRGALTPNEKKELNREAYAAYEFVASYLLENNFASTVDDANVIINNMSENWFESIMEDIRGASYTPNPIGNAIRAGAGLLKNTMNRPSVQGAIKTGSQMLQKSVPSGGYSTREGDGKPRETPLWDGPSKPTPTTPTKPQTKKQPPMRDEPLW